MIEVKIGLDGIPSVGSIVLGNRWENNDEKIYFDLPQEFDQYHKYIVAVMKQKTGNKTVVLPLRDNILVVSSELTYCDGKWNMYLMAREGELDLGYDEIDIGAYNDEHVFISNGFIGIVNKNLIDKEAVDNIPMDTNLQLVYEDLLVLKKQLQDIISNGGSIGGGNTSGGSGDYDGIDGKPKINGVELNGDKSLYDFGYVPIHKLEVKSFPALYMAIKNIGSKLDSEDISTVLFAIYCHELAEEFGQYAVKLEPMRVYTARYNPINDSVSINGFDAQKEFKLDIDKNGVVDYTEHSIGGNIDGKLDVYQGTEYAGMVMMVDDSGNLSLVQLNDTPVVQEENVDEMLKEVFGV